VSEHDAWLDIDERCTPGLYGPKGTLPGYRYTTRCSHPNKCGWLYVVAFSDGVIKVGRTSAAQERIKRHDWDAAKRGAKVVRWWISVKHSNLSQTESVLKQCCSRHWALFAGDEYFADADFDTAVTYAMFFTYARPCNAERLRSVIINPW
jgi:predicted GIY-YIG superfamily endonuclease